MSNEFVKKQLDAAAERVQVEIDREVARLRESMGPLADIRVSTSWSHPNGIEFRAEFSSNYPEKPWADEGDH